MTLQSLLQINVVVFFVSNYMLTFCVKGTGHMLLYLMLSFLFSHSTQNDETTFVVELCFLRRRLYDFYPKYL